MRSRAFWLPAAAMLSLVLSACASDDSASQNSPSEASNPSATGAPPASRPPFRTATPGPLTQPPSPTPTPTPTPAELAPARWEAILAALAERGVTSEPELLSVESRLWNNGALGCPERGQTYTQAQVQGMQVIVEAAGEAFDFRFGRGDSPRLCAG